MHQKRQLRLHALRKSNHLVTHQVDASPPPKKNRLPGCGRNRGMGKCKTNMSSRCDVALANLQDESYRKPYCTGEIDKKNN